jgi:hypothetical protein
MPTSRCPLTPVYRPEIYNKNLAGDAIILFIKQKIKGPCENEQMRQRYPQRISSLSLSFVLKWNKENLCIIAKRFKCIMPLIPFDDDYDNFRQTNS